MLKLINNWLKIYKIRLMIRRIERRERFIAWLKLYRDRLRKVNRKEIKKVNRLMKKLTTAEFLKILKEWSGMRWE